MKTLLSLLCLAVLLTLTAWFFSQGISVAKGKEASPIIEEALPALRAAAPAPTPLMPKTKPARKSPSPLQIALDAGNLCETRKILSKGITSVELATAVLEASNASPELRELFGAEGALYTTKAWQPGEAAKPRYQSAAARLLWALRLGGMNTEAALSSNLTAARELLLGLEKKEPGNAAYPYFRLAVEKKLAFTADQLRATADAIASGTTFDPHAAELEVEFRDAAWLNPAFHYAMTNFHFSAAAPIYEVKQILDEIWKDGQFRGGNHLAELMTDAARHGSRSAWSEFAQDQADWGNQFEHGNFPEFNQLPYDRSARVPGSAYVALDNEEVCDPGPYEASFYELRNAR